MVKATLAAVAVVPARGGSKGLPGKNLRTVGGIPLIGRTVRAARASTRLSEVYVSSDDEAILSCARDYGAVPIVRPAELAGDKSASELALVHALTRVRADGLVPEILVFLQCTSPFTEASDVDRLVEALDDGTYNSALTVSEDHSFLWTLDAADRGGGINHVPGKPRAMLQQLPPQFRENGAG